MTSMRKDHLLSAQFFSVEGHAFLLSGGQLYFKILLPTKDGVNFWLKMLALVGYHDEINRHYPNVPFLSQPERVKSPPLALFIVMFSKAHLTSHSGMSGSR